ncbi:DEAD/DEAH box helicase [Desulfovibrio desulfuricans]|uniref:DEAD/DEAH box helicase n=1 Tax=Desulfovibrio desulfuricans TaxID=876 RepID=UPI001AEB6941|nr:type ISP restriction/modification enzyme [Desulfovibrio desulfuricans]MDD3682641.1 DEAD/DEAH box helicase family protein [Desulfovibrio desulfuricans]QTO40599.1 DEAD/DEAH box helicase [Desulfovibrio desulfuricans]
MTALQKILAAYRDTALTEREKGTYFEKLIICYFKNEASYKDLYSNVWLYSDWAKGQGLDARDTGIDLVAQTAGTGEFHAIQCKLYAEDHRLQKKDIDSFFTASGKKPFTHRIIVCTTNDWSEHAEDALRDQQPPVSKIDLHDLENSQIDWALYTPDAAPALKPKKALRPHQIKAVNAVTDQLALAERGKLIMACGTGKTFTSLKIAEAMAGRGGRVLFLVPSLSLLSQTLTEWTQESAVPLHSFAVCSDSDVGKKRKKDDDIVQTFAHELRYPATTNAARLAEEIARRHDAAHMSVVFATYHSIEVVSRAQNKFDLPPFDIVICDEAHRTTGVTFGDDDESHFVQVHDAAFIHAAKRLYMTATPRIYADSAKALAEKENAALCSMDDPTKYGETLHTITFSEAVAQGLLVDYKVIVLAIEESHVNRRLQELLKNEDNQIKVDDAARIVGCWKALSKQGLTLDGLEEDPAAMRRAVAFCQVIETQHKGKTHKVSSKNIASMFQAVVQSYQQTADDEEKAQFPEAFALTCEAEHVDGGMNASQKEEKLNWLKEETPADTCRVLSNVRCLSEGVDVPALDAVLFLSPRNSQVDVVQSVGRVMRNAPGKKRGYVVLPVVIPAGMEPHEALDNNNTYRVVWQVLQALRSHDDRFDAFINKIDLIGAEPRKMEVIAVCDKLPTQRACKETGGKIGSGSFTLGETTTSDQRQAPVQLTFEMGEIERAIYAKVVKKCGNPNHWAQWASDIAKIARSHIDRIAAILENPENTAERTAFNEFANELRDDLNDSLTDAEIIEMLAQHLITKPVFDALFSDYSFASQNPMSQAMQNVLETLHQHHLSKETDTLQKFYDSVKMKAEGIDNAQGKQKIVVELYDKFFRNAFPRMTEKLGIVYTPVEVVDFIIHSVNDILQQEFGQTLGSDGVHILDPFTGTGTFITRLLQSGLMTPEQIRKKYKDQIHANEIVLLAYYIAAINIESTYHSLVGGPYVPFEGICLTDTFQMYEKEDLIDLILVDNSARRKRQKKLDIRVIVGNPPYSIGQTSANDNNQNVAYPSLDESIRRTYAARTDATNKNALYDSYIRAIRWASDRIGKSGIIGFVTNAGFVEANTAGGLRQCLAEEFSSIYIFHLRGNARTQGETRRKEKDNIFGMGSRAPIAISLLVKNPESNHAGQIFFHDIGEYLSREEKLKAIQDYASIAGIRAANGWQSIIPDEHGDWLQQRDVSFGQFIVLGDKKGDRGKIFDNFSNGLKTQRDSWCYNASATAVAANMERMIAFYNSEVQRFQFICHGLDRNERESKIESFINTDPSKISWTRALKQELVKNRTFAFNKENLIPSLYRPFTKQWLYYNRTFNEMIYQMPKIFPNSASENIAIVVTGLGEAKEFSVQLVDAISDMKHHYNSQCFPLYLYDDPSETKAPSQSQGSLFGAPAPEPKQRTRRDAITDEGLLHFQSAYPGEKISKEDLFYYIYGLLHSEQYREWYADNLAKELPRIPRVKLAADFWAFSKAGRELAKLHIGYESVEPYPATVNIAGGKTLDECQPQDFRVEKMRYGKNGKEKDLTTLHYNSKITVTGIPPEAYEYVVNGKPALDWVVERQCVKTDKDSGIVNDANDWAIETMHNQRYPLELFLRVITVSLETLKIVKALPKLEKEELS